MKTQPQRHPSRTGVAARAPWLLVAGLVFAACGDPDEQVFEPFEGCLPEQIEGLDLRAQPPIARLPVTGPVAVTLTVQPVYLGGGTRPPEGAELYAFDFSGEGVFEATSVTRSYPMSLTEPGRFPVQVSATTCAGRLLVGRSMVQAYRSSPPIVTVRFQPADPYAMFLGSSLVAEVSAIDPDGDDVMDVRWQFGSSMGALPGHDFGAQGAVLLNHTWQERGIFEIVIAVTDRQGDETEIRRPVLISGVVRSLMDEASGARAQDVRVFAGAGSAPATLALAATGRAGVMTYDLTQPGQAIQLGRALLGDPANPRPAQAIEADPGRALAYASADNAGLWFLDLSDTTQPRAFWPSPYLPTGEGAQPRVDRATACADSRWLWVHNTLDGLYLLELADEAALPAARAALPGTLSPPPENPWVEHFRLVAGVSGPERRATIARQGSTRALACADERYVFVIDEAQLDIYDLEPFWGDVANEAARTSVVLPVTAPGIAPGARSLRLVTDPVDPDHWRLSVAAGEHGWLEYEVRTGADGVSSVTLQRHFWSFLDRAQGSDVFDQFRDVWHEGDAVWVAHYSFGFQDGFLEFDLQDWAAPPTHPAGRWYPWKAPKCADIANTGQGDNLGFLVDCRYADAVERFAGRSGDDLWVQSRDASKARLQPFSLAGVLGPPAIIPASWQLVGLAGDFVWVFDGGRVRRLKPPPTEGGPVASGDWEPLPVAPKYLFAGPLVTDVVLANDQQIAWAVRNGQDYPQVVTWGSLPGVQDLAIAADRKSLAALTAADSRLRYRIRDGSQMFAWSPPVQLGGYQRVTACPAEYYALRRETDRLVVDRQRIIDTGGATGWQENPWGTLPLDSVADWSCNADGLWVLHHDPERTRVRVLLYPLGTSGPTKLELAVPYPPHDPPGELSLGIADGLLAVRMGGRMNGVYTFDVRNLAQPLFMAADVGPELARLGRFQVGQVGTSIRYAGIYNDPSRGTRLMVRQVD